MPISHFRVPETLSFKTRSSAQPLFENEFYLHKNKNHFQINAFIYQLFWAQACPEGMCTNGTQVPCEVPSLPPGSTTPTLFQWWSGDVGSFTSHKNKLVKVLWDGTYGFLSLSEKTRKSNHLQMSSQRQHFLLSYLKTLSVGPASVWTRDLPLGRPTLSQLSQQGGT